MIRIILFIVALLVWSGLVWPVGPGQFIVGVIVSGLVAILTGGLFTNRPHLFKQANRYLWFCYYVPMFIWECFKANVDVALRVAHPDLPIHPGIVKVKTSLKSETGLTFLANSITLTPGTLSVDIDQERGVIYVHWINVIDKSTEKATEIIVNRFEKVLKKIFE